MVDIQDLHIHIVSIDFQGCAAAVFEFQNDPDVAIHNCDIREFVKYNKVDCLVSPGNAFGLMTGGYDAALSDILGHDFQMKVQSYIKQVYYGEQVVGTSFIIDTGVSGMRLIHTPTMRYPSIIKDDMIVYHCMRSTLICALNNDIKSIVIPLFGALSGQVSPSLAAKHMKAAYNQIKNQQWADHLF